MHPLRPQRPVRITLAQPHHPETFPPRLIHLVERRHEQFHLDSGRPAPTGHVDVFCEQSAGLQETGLRGVRGEVGDGGAGDEVVPLRPGGGVKEGVEHGLGKGIDGGGCTDGEGGSGLGAPVWSRDGGDEL